MGLGPHKSPATPKPETPARSSPPPNAFKSPTQFSGGKPSAFSRSFGVYFPRSSSQVQPRPPDVADLLRLIEELREKESRLKTEILEQKILRETVALVPSLEREVAAKNGELDRARGAVEGLEAENRALRMEVERLIATIGGLEEEGRRRDGEIEELKRSMSSETEDCSSSSRFRGLIDASSKSVLLKSIRESPKLASDHPAKSWKGEEEETAAKPRAARVPKPPPLPTASMCGSSKIEGTRNAIPMPPPPPPPRRVMRNVVPMPPPPPPLPAARGGRCGEGSVRRVPEVVEFYHSMMRRDAKRDSGGGGADLPAAGNARDMIGEIENRSAHLLAVSFCGCFSFFPEIVGCIEFTNS